MDANGDAVEAAPAMRIYSPPAGQVLAMVMRNPRARANLNNATECFVRNHVTSVVADPIVLELGDGQFPPILPANFSFEMPSSLEFTTTEKVFFHTASPMPELKIGYEVDHSNRAIIRHFYTIPTPAQGELTTSASAFSPTLTAGPTRTSTSRSNVFGLVATTTPVTTYTYTSKLFQNAFFEGDTLFYDGSALTTSTALPTVTVQPVPESGTKFSGNVSFSGGIWNRGPTLSATNDGLMAGAVGVAALAALTFGAVSLVRKRFVGQHRAQQETAQTGTQVSSASSEVNSEQA